MKRQQMIIQNQYGSSNSNENSAQRQSGAPHQGSAPNPAMFSQMQLPHGSIPPQLFSQTPDQPHHYDARSPSLLGSIQRTRMPAGSPMHFSGPQSYQPRRVSLLRDIGRAGERDRDLSTTSSIADGHDIVNLYSGATPSRHISTPPLQPMGNYDRPITLLGNMTHSYQQPHIQQDQAHVAPAPHHSMSTVDIKKEPGSMPKQELSSKAPTPVAHLPSRLNVVPLVPAVVQQQPSVASKNEPAMPMSGFEQKSKEDLVQAMDKVDREMSKVAAEITRLQKRKTQLEESAKKPPEPEKEEATPRTAEPKHRDLWQIIYAENRKKAENARTVLDGICPIYDMPLYNQPSDTQVFQENLENNEEMRPKLLKFFQHRRKLSNIREKYLSARYDQMMDDWQRKTEKIENGAKRKAKEAKTREFFEKLFPEIRKQREQQERVERVGTRGDTCRSDADFAEIVDGLSEQENQLQHMRHLAVVPPMLLDKEERRVVFINNNGFINDPFSEFKESQQLDAWAAEEKAIFKEKYVQHPKNFHVIASFIEKKSVADCILYYYLTKKANNYKGLVRKHTLKPRKPKSGRAHTSHQHDQSGAANNNKDASEKADKDETKKELDCEVDEVKQDKPPSPRMTRARKQTMNWTEEEISLVKEGFGKHGRDFSSISRMVTKKTEQQVRNFYHNYKKKYGLDQLITDSKKKKTRTRHVALSPDVPPVAEEEAQRKESKSDRDKVEETGSAEEMKKPRERSPSPSAPVPVPKSTSSDLLDAASASTTYIRTRRTTAALAAAATTQDTQEASANKRPSEKLQSTSGEPAEKKAKKNERKSRSQKTSESARIELAKSEAVKDVVASLTSKSNNDEKTDDISESDQQLEDLDTAADAISTEKKEESESKATDERVVDMATDDVTSGGKQPVASNKQVSTAKKYEHDSSATCSADEEDNMVKSQGSRPSKANRPSSPYYFEDSPNDCLTIRIDRTRQQDGDGVATTAIATTSNLTVSVSSAPTTTVLDLANKIPISVTPVAISDSRPQSLPPASMVPTVSFPFRPSMSSAPVLQTGLDLSCARPSSTPAHPDLTTSNPPGRDAASNLFAPPKRDSNQSENIPSKAVVISTSPVIVKNIEELTYTARKPAASSPPITVSHGFASVVDLTKDASMKKLSAPVSKQVPVEGVPVWKHQYHVTHPMAASLQKDFQPITVSSLTTPVVSVPLSSYSRVYTSKDKLAMKERAAVIPEAPIPVSSLRFTSASSKPAPNLLATPHRTPVSDEIAFPRHFPVKEEARHSPVLPMVPPGRLHSPRTSAPIPHITAPSNYPHPRMMLIPSSVARLPETHAPAEKMATPQHVPLPGGSITQGKPVFRAQVVSSAGSQEGQKMPATSIRGSILQGTPSSALVSHGSLPSPDASSRSSSDLSEARLAALSQNSLALNAAAQSLQNARFPPTFVLPPSVKTETSPDLHAKTITPEDIRQSLISSGAPAGASLHHDPHHHILNAASLSQLPANLAAFHGMPMKSLESSLSPKSLSRRSITPPQTKIVERKASGPPSDHLPRRSSPLVHQPGMESFLKEDVKRPSSASRATPERRSGFDKSMLAGHHAMTSAPYSIGSSKPRRSSSAEGKISDEHFAQSHAEQQQQQHQQILQWQQALFNPLLGISFDPVALQSLIGQYRHPGPALPGSALPGSALPGSALPGSALSIPPGLLSGFPPGANPLVRAYTPTSGEGRESSHKVLAHDFATAQKLLQQPSLAGMAAARNLPFSVSLQPSVLPQPHPSSAGMQSSLQTPRHSNSPSSLERLNFIPQHGTLPSSRSSPHRSDGSPKTTNPQSPSSPHGSLKSQFVPGFIPSSHDPASRPGSDRRQMGSPMMPSPGGVEQRAFSSFSGVSIPLDVRQHSPLMYSTSPKHPLVSKSSHSMPEGLAPREPNPLASSYGSSAPQLLRHTASSLASHSSRPKSVKQEHYFEHMDASRYTPDAARRYSHSPDHAARHHSSDSSRGGQRMEVYEGAQKLKQVHGTHSTKERSDKQALEHVGDPQHEKAANDLKTKGKAKITPKILINTIIDHNINQYAQCKAKQKPQRAATPDRKPVEVKAKEKMHQAVDPGLYGMATKAPSSDKTPPHSIRNTTLLEHSTGIISNIYRTDPPKPKTAEPTKQEESSVATSQQRFFDVPVSRVGDQQSRRSEVSRSSLVMHPFTPSVLSKEEGSMESIIRKALMGDKEKSPSADNMRQSRPICVSSAQYLPAAKSFHPEKPSSGSLHGSPQEPKRSEPHIGRNSPAPSAQPQMFSALSFRKSQSSVPSQQITPPTTLPGRTVHAVGSSSSAGLGSTPVFHPQPSPAIAERAPLPTTQYEPLSDDEN